MVYGFLGETTNYNLSDYISSDFRPVVSMGARGSAWAYGRTKKISGVAETRGGISAASLHFQAGASGGRSPADWRAGPEVEKLPGPGDSFGL